MNFSRIFASETLDHLDVIDMKIPPAADIKARLTLAHSPRFQALLDESRRSILAGKGLTRTAFWNAVAERRRKKD